MIVPRFDLAVGARELSQVVRRIVCGRATGSATSIRNFEEEFADWLDGGASRAFFLSSGRMALYLVLLGMRRLSRPPGERPLVLVPAWTHASVPLAVRAAHYVPWFVDADPETLNPDLKAVPAEVWPHVAAVVVTHLYGTPAALSDWVGVARAHGAVVIEDCAQALGARYDEQRCGAYGDAAYFSFALTKNFTTLRGGLLSVRDPQLREAVRPFVSTRPSKADLRLMKEAILGLGFYYATRPSIFATTIYPALRVGWSVEGRDILHSAFEEMVSFTPPGGFLGEGGDPLVMPPPGICADLGRAQLFRLDHANARRTQIGYRLRELLGGTPLLGLPSWEKRATPIFMSFVLRAPRRMAFIREMLRRGVDCSPGYLRACDQLELGPKPISQLPCPNAGRLEHSQVHLPVYPRMTDREVEFIARTAHAAFEHVHADLVARSHVAYAGPGR